ncbi:MAG: alcohol dehydrogenase catalytic domain-containing protein [Candidatus Accumulibacter sp.]|jgi:(R,R)-butanediol dehydrogenase/meso-butanediol dehydrogenase/diacetyl reductase/L-iditol 2-dehydrogenase|nr:alcohol dehydrogenase catalytic domain-containing protein [Accumulibacter sp.]
MKALLMEEYKELKFVDVPDPEIGDPHDILVRVRAVSICGSDVHGFDGSTGRRRPPIIMGHEAAGEIVATGDAVKNFKAGDRITFDSTIYCGHCFYCRNGDVNLCEHRQVLGVSCDEYRRHGAFAEYVRVPDHICYHLPEGLSCENAALTEPVAVAAHAFRVASPGLDESVAVVGSGLIGLLLIQILRASISGRIIALDTDAARRRKSLEAGADTALDPVDPELDKKVKAQTHGLGVNHTFEAVGATAPIQTAIAITRKGGSVVLIGNFSPRVEIPLQSVVSRQIRLHGSCAIAGEYPIALDLMARKKIDVGSIISKIAPLSEGPLWFDKLYRREDGLLKVVLVP